MHFAAGHIQLLAEYEGIVDTTITSSPIGLIRLSILPASNVRSLFNDEVQITGDVGLGQELKNIFDNLDIDWEGHVATFTGDVVAYQLGNVVRKGINFQRQFSTSMQHNVTDYLQEELRVFPCSEEIDDFCNDVDIISLDVERLEANINQLDKEK